MGIFSRKSKKTDESKITLRGFPGHADTSKCLLAAAEKGMEVEFELTDFFAGNADKPEYRSLSPLGKVPCLSDGDFVTSGEMSILTYLELQGAGSHMIPKKARLLGEQNYWIDVARHNVGPQVDVLTKEEIYGPMNEPGYVANAEAVEKARNTLAKAFDALNNQLENNTYVIGNFSLADIHWAAYAHSCLLAGEQDLIEQRANVRSWFERIKKRRSQNDQSIVPYDRLPTLDDVKNKRFRSVA